MPLALVGVVETTALVESRADQYAHYLLSVFAEKPKWHSKIRLWNLEERQHGQSLRRWSEAANRCFDFESSYARYLDNVKYHMSTGRSVRGSIKDELVSRCVVEALASGYYAALHDSCDEPLLKDICNRLRQDEARHFSMFHGFLRETGGVTPGYFLRALFVSLRRMAELDDEQIVYAAYCVGQYNKLDWHRCRKRVAAEYFVNLLQTYRWKHAYYICGLLLKIFDFGQGTVLHRLISTILYVLIRLKLQVSKLRLRWSRR